MIINKLPWGGGLKGVPLGNCSGIAILIGDKKLKFKWTDPENIVSGGETVAAWAGTKLVRKAGSYPADEKDGTLVVDSKTKNAYKDDWYTDSGLANGTEYFYALFPYTEKVTTYNDDNRISGTPVEIPLAAVTGLTAVHAKNRIYLKWTDPEDIAATSLKDGAVWAGTKVVRKAGSAATSVNDGTLVVTSTVRNQYRTIAYEDSGLTNGSTYYYAIFAYTSDGTYSERETIRGTPNPYPTDAAKNSSVTEDDTKLIIKWTDPDDKTVNGDTVTWANTKLVRKIGSVPTWIGDGTLVVTSTIRNQYETNGFIDTGLTNGTTYYYRLFAYSTDGACAISFAGEGTPAVQFSSVLSENSWDKIAKASAEGKASTLWSVGDEIDITLTGAYAQTLTLQIADFGHDDLADGSGKAGITFACKNLMKDTKRMNSSNTNSGGWDNTEMFTTTLPTVLDCLPASLKSVIKQVKKASGTGSGSSSGTEQSTNKLFLFAEKEVNLNSYSVSSEGTAYPIFTDNASRIKKLSNGTGAAFSWWLRSPFSGYPTYFCFVYSSGSTGYFGASDSFGVCFGFCV